jgi:hypothetical protein
LVVGTFEVVEDYIQTCHTEVLEDSVALVVGKAPEPAAVQGEEAILVAEV